MASAVEAVEEDQTSSLRGSRKRRSADEIWSRRGSRRRRDQDKTSKKERKLRYASCGEKSDSCDEDEPCCSSLVCSNETSATFTCTPCLAVGKPCNRGASVKICCDECNPVTNRCDSCHTNGAVCTNASTCCEGSCINGTCVATLSPTTGSPTTRSPTTRSPTTRFPTLTPTEHPTQHPTGHPTGSPTWHPTESPTGHPSLPPTFSPLATKEPSLFPTPIPTSSPSFTILRPRAELVSSPVSVPGSAAFVGAFVALAAFFVFARRRNKALQHRTMEEVRRNRKFASRKSITTFIDSLERDKEDFLIDPQRLDLGRVIGLGSHGVVYEGLYLGEEVAVKELVLEEDEKEAKDSRKRFLQEMLALRRLRHPNIIRLIGVGALKTDDDVSRTFFFVMELAKCSLRDLMQDDTMRISISTLPKSLAIARQVCDGLAYMHHMKLIHLDLKPENILISETGQAKICDLGLSEVITTNPGNSKGNENKNVNADPTLQELQGTSPYIAPELVTDFRESAPKYAVSFTADVYSFGMVLWELLHAPMPSHPLSWDPYRILVEVKYNNYRPRIDKAIPPKIAAIVKFCWASNPNERPDLHELSAELGVLIDEFGKVPFASVNDVMVVVDEFRSSRKREMSRSAML